MSQLQVLAKFRDYSIGISDNGTVYVQHGKDRIDVESPYHALASIKDIETRQVLSKIIYGIE